jgi:hypothetical protein
MHLFVQIHFQSDNADHSSDSANSTPQSFEALAVQLGMLPGMYFEMDGSFVWVDHTTPARSQLDGMVYDRDGKLQYIELKGNCSPAQWHALCQAVCGLEIDPWKPDTEQSSAGQSNAGQSNADSELFDFTQIDRVLRIHHYAEGIWSQASEIASQLSLR